MANILPPSKRKPVDPDAPLRLTLKQRRAVDNYYGNGGDKSAALLAAGYSQSVARNNPMQVYNHPAIVQEMERREAELKKKHGLDADWVIQRFMKIADANLGNILLKLQQNDYVLTCLTEDERYAINEIVDEVDVESSDYVDSDMEPGTKIRKSYGERRLKIKLASKLDALQALGKHLNLFTETLKIEGEVTLVERLQKGRQRAGIAGSK